MYHDPRLTPPMTEPAAEFYRCSLWADGDDVYHVGRGTITINSSYAKLRVDPEHFDAAEPPMPPTGFEILASDADGVVYEGVVKAVHRPPTDDGPVVELRCKPTDLAD